MNNESINNLDSEFIKLKDLYYIINNNLKLFLSIFFSFLLVSIIYIYTSIPLYESYGSVLIQSNTNNFSLFSEIGMGGKANPIDNEVEILKSNKTINKVLDELIRTGEYRNMHLFRTKDYDLPKINKIFRKIFFADFFSNNTPISIENQYHRKILIEDFKDRLTINKINKTDLIEISLLSPNPEESATIINLLVASYQNIDREWNNGEMIHMKDFLDSQISIKKEDLNLIENKLSDFQKEYEIYGLDGNAELLLNQLTIIESDYYANKAQENILQKRKEYLYNELTQEEKLLTEKVMNTINERLNALKFEIAQKESDLISAIALQGENHQVVLSGQKTLNKLKETLKDQTNILIDQGISIGDPIQYRQSLMDTILVIEASQATLASKSFELKKLVEKYEYELSSLPDKSLTFARLERERNILSETYALMMKKREESKIREASQLGKIRIVDLASPDIIPVSPNKILIIALFTIIGFLVGSIVCFLKDNSDS